jgi:hypothetical protein
MYFGKRHVAVEESPHGKLLIFKDDYGNNQTVVGLSFEDAKEIAKELNPK